MFTNMFPIMSNIFKNPNQPSSPVPPTNYPPKDDSRLFDYIKLGCTLVLTYYISYKFIAVVETLLGKNASVSDVTSIKKVVAQKLRRPEIENMVFSSHELRLMSDVLGVDELKVGFSDIGGMEKELQDIMDNVILPIKILRLNTSMSSLVSPFPTGILLYGKPGTGKSLTAKAIAKEAGATFLNIKASSIMDKYLGESDKLVYAMFQLARKLAPTVIFIDEIETLLRKRDGNHSDSMGAVRSMQGVFLSEWDGLNGKDDQSSSNGNPAPVLVLGATNRPMDLDEAFLRRMPVKVCTKVPDEKGRKAILKSHLNDEELHDNVDLDLIASQCEGYTGSDIRELVRLATINRAKDCLSTMKDKMVIQGNSGTSSDIYYKKTESIRPLDQSDLLIALEKSKAIGE